MLKADLHFHTKKVKTGDSKARDISEKDIDKYIKIFNKYNVNIVAITNHNYFDLNQYRIFKNKFEDAKIKLWPGVELDYMLNNKRYQFNLICNPEIYDILAQKFKMTTKKEMENLCCGNLNEFLKKLNKEIKYEDFFLVLDWKNYNRVEDNGIENFYTLLEKLKINNALIIETSTPHLKHFLIKEKNIFSLRGSDQRNFQDFQTRAIKKIKAIQYNDADNDIFEINNLFSSFREKVKSGFFKRYLDDNEKLIFTVPYGKKDNFDEDLNFKQGINLILGDTGTGKSRILNEIKNQLNFANEKNEYDYYDGSWAANAANEEIKKFHKQTIKEIDIHYNNLIPIKIENLIEYNNNFNSEIINSPYIFWKDENEEKRKKISNICEKVKRENITNANFKRIIFKNYFNMKTGITNLNEEIEITKNEQTRTIKIINFYKKLIKIKFIENQKNILLNFTETKWKQILKEKSIQLTNKDTGFEEYFIIYKNIYNEINSLIKIFNEEKEIPKYFCDELSESKKNIKLIFSYSLGKNKEKYKNTIPIIDERKPKKINWKTEGFFNKKEFEKIYNDLNKIKNELLTMNISAFLDNYSHLKNNNNIYMFNWQLELFSEEKDKLNKIEYLSNGENAIYEMKKFIKNKKEYMLIDEIEKNFSTKSLLKFKDSIETFTNKIFIITTHNPSVWSSFNIRTITIKKYNKEKEDYEIQFFDLSKIKNVRNKTSDFVLDVLEGGPIIFNERKEYYNERK